MSTLPTLCITGKPDISLSQHYENDNSQDRFGDKFKKNRWNKFMDSCHNLLIFKNDIF